MSADTGGAAVPVDGRVEKFWNTKIADWPDGLRDFVNYRANRYGACSEVARAAIEDFCSYVAPGNEWTDDGFREELRARDAELAMLTERARRMEEKP